MPYMMRKQGDKIGIYKKGPDGEPMGKALGMHDTEEEAMAQMRALHANEKMPMDEARKLRTGDLHELVSLQEAELDPANYSVKVRLIQSGWSKNGRYYPDDTLKTAAPMWEGVKAYADHPGRNEAKDRPERSVRDIVGIYENVAHDANTTRANFRVLGAARDWLWPLIEESVATKRDLIGLSINALGQTSKGEIEGKKGIVVEAITHANSVDVVTEPAAGGGFEQLMMSDDGWTRAVLDSVSLDELREARPDVIDNLKREWQTVRDSAALEEAKMRANRAEAQAKALEEEKRTLEAQLQDAQSSIARVEKERKVDSLLEGARLPGEWRDDLRAELLDADQTTWINILEAEKRKAKAIKPKTNVTGSGSSAGPQLARLRIENQAQGAVIMRLHDDAPKPDEDFSAWKNRTHK